MQLAPKNLVTLAAAATLAIIAIAAFLALQPPRVGIAFTAADPGGLRVAAVDPRSPNLHRVEPQARITAFLDAHGKPVPADADLLIEEPDQLEVWPRYNDFMARQTRLAQATDSGSIVAVLEDGRHVELAAYPRSLGDLPALFWVQVLVGLLAFSISAGVWAFRPNDRAAAYYALAGLGLMLSSVAAAVYSSRELIMDGTLVRPLSLINHFGALFFTAALLCLLWNYPRRVARFPLEIPAFGIMMLAWLSDLFEFAPDMAWAQYLPVLVLFAPTFLLALIQWRMTRGLPVERAALKWYLLSIFIGTGLFAGVILIPVALGMEPVASQGMMFVVFLFMFIGIALGILRYRLFDLDRWWFTAWLWLLGGMLVVAFDFVLAGLMHFTEMTALALSLALAGWLYFPLRQWLFQRMLPRRNANAALPDEMLQALFSAPDRDSLIQRWRQMVREIFEPLEFTVVAAAAPAAELVEHGQTLKLPCLDGAYTLRLSFPAHGGRLFSREDCVRATSLHSLGVRLTHALEAREQGMHDERQRIIHDVHDDLGAKLLSLIYTAENPGQQALARSAVQDMRDILTSLEGGNLPLGEGLAILGQELDRRAAELDITIRLEAPLDCDQPVSARIRTNLARVVREAVSNAARHGRARAITAVFFVRDDTLEFSVCDDGPGDPATWSAGRGMRSMRKRIGELGGVIDWRRDGQSCCLFASLPLGTAVNSDQGAGTLHEH